MRRLTEVLMIMLVLNGVGLGQPVDFAESALKAKVEEALGVTDPNATDMLDLTELYADWLDISDLTGLEYATNLETVSLQGNQISDLSPLAGLTKLGSLMLHNNPISDLSPLAGLVNLSFLVAVNNQISDISALAGMTNLEKLKISENQISDLSALAGLTSLSFAELSDNQISDLFPLVGLTHLTYLGLRDNPLDDDACVVYIPQIRGNNPGIEISYDACAGCVVPEVAGLTLADAEAALTAAGLVADVWWADSDMVPADHVISQDPSAGAEVPSGSMVMVVISWGPGSDPEPEPDVYLPVPVAHWRLDETGGTIAHDVLGAHDGTLLGSPMWVLDGGPMGGALAFDGRDDYVDTGYTEDLATWTVSVWVNSPAAPSGWVTTGPVHREKNYQINWDHADATFRGAAALDVGGAWYAASFGWLAANTWCHLAATYDGQALRAYKNGTLVATNDLPSGNPDPETASLKLGRQASDSQYFAGMIDDVRVYDCALSGVEVGELLKPGPEGNVVAYWKLDEKEGAVAHDSAAYHHGELDGDPIWQPAGGHVDGALMFDGLNDRVLTDFVLDPASGPFNVFAWVKGGAPGAVILSQDGAAGGCDWLATDPETGRLMTDLKGAGRSARSLISDAVITDNSWHKVGFVWNGSERTLVVDGVTVAEDSQAELGSSWGGLNIGTGNLLQAGSFWSGLIDDVRLAWPEDDEPPIIISVVRANGQSDNKAPIGSYDGNAAVLPTQAGGLQDGNLCFSDRTYSWAITPAPLVGAEYVRVFNSDKKSTAVTYTVTTSREATVMVTVDDRTLDQQEAVDRATAWFAPAGTFADTGLDLFIHENAATDRPIRVFSARLPAGTYVFGAVPSAHNFYTIAVMD